MDKPEEVDEKVYASLSRKDAMHIFHVQMDTVRMFVDSFRRVADSLNRVAEMLERTLPETTLETQRAQQASVNKH